MAKVIVGIHGLGNKPPADVLTAGYRQSIVEGLDNIGVSGAKPDVRSIFWADLLHPDRLHADLTGSADLLDDQPYVPALPGTIREYRQRPWDPARAWLRGRVGWIGDRFRRRFGADRLSTRLLKKRYRDLALYYDDDATLTNRRSETQVVRAATIEVVTAGLQALAGLEVMLFAHSMGSIVAYEALRDLGRRPDNDIVIAHFVTIGSPLGLPMVKVDIERRGRRPGWPDDPVVRTPSIVTRSWVNYADWDDKVAADTRLRDDYAPNASGVRVRDDLVDNTYFAPKTAIANPHKVYGYLRTPEIARHVRDFLSE